MLRAGTVTKRTELLLDQLGIDENKWRVGKTLVFLKDYEIMYASTASTASRVPTASLFPSPPCRCLFARPLTPPLLASPLLPGTRSTRCARKRLSSTSSSSR